MSSFRHVLSPKLLSPLLVDGPLVRDYYSTQNFKRNSAIRRGSFAHYLSRLNVNPN